MKKLILTFALFSVACCIKAQNIILYEGFNSYNGTTGSIPSGFSISWNDSTSSFYSGATSCGQSCNSYKFGMDSATILTPFFSNAGSVQFFFKGNGTLNPQNTFYIYESPDGNTWSQIAAIAGFNTSQQTLVYPLQQTTIQLKFYYSKPTLGLNVAFDDLTIFSSVGIREHVTGKQPVVYPAPTTGVLNILFPETIKSFNYSVTNILGKELTSGKVFPNGLKNAIDFSDLADGIYFIRVKSSLGETSLRFIIRK